MTEPTRLQRQLEVTREALAPLDASIGITRGRMHSARDRIDAMPDSPHRRDLVEDHRILLEALDHLGRARTQLQRRAHRLKAAIKRTRHAERDAEFERLMALPVPERREACEVARRTFQFSWSQEASLRSACAEDGKHPYEPAHRVPGTIYAVDLMRSFWASQAFSMEALTRSIVGDSDLYLSRCVRNQDAHPPVTAETEATLRNLRGY